MDKLQTNRRQSGQVLVLLALWMVSLVAILALVLDGGRIYLERRRMQNAADAGATAGARALALDGTAEDAQATAQEYAVTYNGADSADVSVADTIVTVLTCESVPMTFARVIGLNSTTVCATASAQYGPIAAAIGLSPLAIREFDLDYNMTYTIWDDESERDPTTGYISGSYRGWLNLPCVYPTNCGGAGATELKDWMHNGYQSSVEFDDWIRGDGGVKAAVIQQAYVGQELKIPIYDMVTNLYTNEAYYHVIAFSVFKVNEVIATGSPKGIRGKFIRYFTPGPPTGPNDYGWTALDLIQ